MTQIKKLEQKLTRAENILGSACFERNNLVKELFWVRNGENYIPLYVRYTNEYGDIPDDLSARIKKDGCDVYDSNSKSRQKITREAVNELSTLEKKIRKYNVITYYLEAALDCYDADGRVSKFSERELAKIKAELETKNYHI